MSNGNVTMAHKLVNFQSQKNGGKISNNAFEKSAWRIKATVCGIDEVGRGCLAGPLVTAAVILPAGKTNKLLKDSKIMSEADRIKAYAWIKKNCFYGIGIASNRLVDRHNIWQTTLIAMEKAVINLMAITPVIPVAFLVDAMPLKLANSVYNTIPVYHFPKGEQKSCSIAAASIIAKVWRDELVKRMDNSFPGYALAEHKGYATQKHRVSLRTQNISLIHRISFLKNNNQEKKEAYAKQQSLC